MARAVFAIVATLLIGSLLAIAGGSARTHIVQATPERATAVVIASEVLVRTAPHDVPDPELALGRVTIMPGAVIPILHHPGTQICAVVQGTLTYTEYTGMVDLVRADRPEEPPYTIAASETVSVTVGDAVIETPGSMHQGRNDGTVPVIIYLSTLFPTGAPRSTIDATLTP